MSGSALAGLQALERFHYDSMDRVIAQGPSAVPGTRSFYRDTDVASVLTGAQQRRLVRSGDHLLGVCDQAGGANINTLVGAGQQGSVLRAAGPSSTGEFAYTPYGEGADPLLPGFNGQPSEPSTGYYLLGNGYRAYNPRLMRFNSPDSFSPFDGAGLNPYAYCLGDPINQSDPTGHMSIGAWIGVAFGALAVVIGGVIIGAAVAPVALPAVAAFFGLAPATTLTIGAVAAITAGVLTIGSGATGIASAGLREKDPYSDFATNMGWISTGLAIGAAAIGGVSALVKLSSAYDNALKSAFDVYAKSASRAAAGAGARAAGQRGGSVLHMLPADDLMAASLSTRAFTSRLLQPFEQLARNAAAFVTQLQNPRVITAAQHFAKVMAKDLLPSFPGGSKTASASGAMPTGAPGATSADTSPATPAHAARIRNLTVAGRGAAR